MSSYRSPPNRRYSTTSQTSQIVTPRNRSEQYEPRKPYQSRGSRYHTTGRRSTPQNVSARREKNELTNITIPDINVQHLPKDSIEYQEQFTKYIISLLYTLSDSFADLYNENDPTIDKAFSAENQEIWQQAFIHKSANPDVNYDALEYYGDKTWDFGLASYMMEKYKLAISSDAQTRLRNKFSDKKFLSSLATSLGFEKWIIAKSNIDISMREDVFEAFMGSVFAVFNSIDKALVFPICSEIVAKIIDNFDFSQIVVRDSVSYIKEKFESLGWGSAVVVPQQVGRMIKVTISIPPVGIKMLRDIGIDISPIIGIATGQTANVTEKIAHDNAVTQLNELGLTNDWFIEQRKLFVNIPRSELKPEMQTIMDQFTMKKNLNGIKNVYFNVRDNPKNPSLVTITMYGVKDTSNRRNDGNISLLTMDANRSALINDAYKMAMIEIYVNKK